MFHRAEVFLRGKLDVGGCNVVHEVDERFAAAANGPQRRHGRVDSGGIAYCVHRLHGGAGAELRMGSIPIQLATRLREQVHGGRMSTGHRQHIRR